MKMFAKLWMLIAMLSVSASALAYDFEFDMLYYNIILDNEVEVTYGDSKYSGSLRIPAQVEFGGKNYAVTVIGENAFKDSKDLTKLEFGSNIRKISNAAFLGCESLTSIGMGSYVTEIGDYAFNGCKSLTSVDIPGSVTKIGNCSFAGCSKLASMTIPNSVITIGDLAFSYCGAMASLTIGNSVQTIGANAFLFCSGLSSIIIPDSVISIGKEAFSYCWRLQTVKIGNSVTTIGESAFSECNSLTSLTIGSSVELIRQSAFAACGQIANIYCHASIPPVITLDVFDYDVYSNAILYVPRGYVSVYDDSSWNAFVNIKDGDFVGVEKLVAGDAEIVGYCNMQGVMSTEPWDGVNIVVYSDGTHRKVMIKR